MPFDGVIEADAVSTNLFARAADLLEKDGWCQTAWVRETARCLLAALRVARGEPADMDGYRPSDDAVAEQLGFSHAHKAARWNDRQTSVAPVLALLRKAAGEKIAAEPPPAVVDPVDDVIRGAITLLQRDGWCQDAFNGENGSRCVLKAIADAIPAGHERERKVMLGRALTRAAMPENVIVWNDTPGRTKDEVIARLKSGLRSVATREIEYAV